jgi:hypothetical protein
MTNEQKLVLDLVLSVVPVGPGNALPLRGIVQRLDGRCPDDKVVRARLAVLVKRGEVIHTQQRSACPGGVRAYYHRPLPADRPASAPLAKPVDGARGNRKGVRTPPACFCPQVRMEISEWVFDEHGNWTRTIEGIADPQAPAVVRAREWGREAGLAAARARRALSAAGGS